MRLRPLSLQVFVVAAEARWSLGRTRAGSQLQPRIPDEGPQLLQHEQVRSPALGQIFGRSEKFDDCAAQSIASAIEESQCPSWDSRCICDSESFMPSMTDRASRECSTDSSAEAVRHVEEFCSIVKLVDYSSTQPWGQPWGRPTPSIHSQPNEWTTVTEVVSTYTVTNSFETVLWYTTTATAQNTITDSLPPSWYTTTITAQNTITDSLPPSWYTTTTTAQNTVTDTLPPSWYTRTTTAQNTVTDTLPPSWYTRTTTAQNTITDTLPPLWYTTTTTAQNTVTDSFPPSWYTTTTTAQNTVTDTLPPMWYTTTATAEATVTEIVPTTDYVTTTIEETAPTTIWQWTTPTPETTPQETVLTTVWQWITATPETTPSTFETVWTQTNWWPQSPEPSSPESQPWWPQGPQGPQPTGWGENGQGTW